MNAETRELLRLAISNTRKAKESTRVYPRCAGCGRDMRDEGRTEGCSHCWDRFKKRQRRVDKEFTPKAVGATAVCVTCSKEFEAKASHQKHCSQRCNKRYAWRRMRERLRSDPAGEAEYLRQQRERVRKCQRPHVVVVVATCVECGVEFQPRINTSQAKFCCPEHKWAWHSRRKREAA